MGCQQTGHNLEPHTEVCNPLKILTENYVKKLKGIFPENELHLFAKAILNRAIKLQIGCGTEPTLYKSLDKIIRLGKTYKVPYISMTTNANNIELEQLRTWCSLGLDEITVIKSSNAASLSMAYNHSFDSKIGNKFIHLILC